MMKRYKPTFWIAIGLIFLVGLGQVISSTSRAYASSPLVISEFLAANGAGLTDEDGDYSDWIEIYNRSAYPVNLSGWSLTDDSAQPEKWTFPDLTLEAGGYLIVFASAKDRKATTALHTNFKLSRAGEFLGLYNILDGRFAEIGPAQFPAQLRDISYGHTQPGESYAYLATPTPGEANTPRTWAGPVSEIAFSHPRGFYELPFKLELLSLTSEAAIYYTLDGSEPSATNGTPYTGPIEIEKTTIVRAVAVKAGYLPSSINTHSYLFLADVLKQPAQPPGFPATWGTHQTTIWEYVAGTPVVADYEMDPEIVNHPRYSQTLKDDLRSIPTLSLVTAIDHFGEIYGNPQERGRAWERPVSVELITPGEEQQGFQINAGLRLHGARGREAYILKHSFRLFFRNEYGSPRLRYSLFPDSPVDSFDTLILRGGVNRSYAGQLRSDKTGFELATYIEDEWLRASQQAMSGYGVHGIFVHLYINGLYWGLYNVVERPDAAFMASYFGGEEPDWFAMNADGPLDQPIEIFESLQQELYNINQLPFPERYPAIQKRIDTTHFADYLILNWYAGTKDWPHNNWYAGLQLPDGKIRYFVWDGEVIWLDGANISLGDGTANPAKQFFEALSQYPDFQIEFADRLYKHLFNGGALSDEKSQERWLELSRQVEQAIVGESARWGDNRYEQPITQADWFKARDNVLAQMAGNGAKLIELARAEGYYPQIDPPEFRPHGGLVAAGMPLPLQSSRGTIFYTLDGSDPRLPGSGDVAPGAKPYLDPLLITQTTHLKARTFLEDGSGRVWSALNEATFTVANLDPKIQITEIMYNPSDGSEYEFIELYNAGDTDFDLSNSTFTGIEFTFPVNTHLAPGEFIVLVHDAPAFQARYPGVVVGGVYQGRLANDGEEILLEDIQGQPITGVQYDDENGWPLSPDRRGDSLVRADLDGDPNHPKSWRASTQLYGSPGAAETKW